MIIFVAICIFLIVVALLFLITPLLSRKPLPGTSAHSSARNATVYQDQLAEIDAELGREAITQAQWAASRAAIERRALDEAEETPNSPRVGEATAPARRATITASILGILLPLAAIGLYILLGAPQGLSPAPDEGQQAVTSEQIEAMVSKLAERLKSNAGDTDGWIMLGRSYAAMGRFQESANAFSKAAAQRPADAQLLADYADALGMANGRNLKGEPEALITRALKADSGNVKALTLAGTIAYQNADYRKAIALWEAILPKVPAEDPFAESVRGIISDAKMQLENTATKKGRTPQPSAKADADQTGAASLQGTVSLAPALKSKANPDDTVFIYARATSGPRMPLAIMRSTVRELPVQFSLDDSSAMSPTMKLSAFDKVVVVARVSRSGNPAPQKGDLEGVTSEMAPRARGLKVEISSTIN